MELTGGDGIGLLAIGACITKRAYACRMSFKGIWRRWRQKREVKSNTDGNNTNSSASE
jgi:predicted transposase YbfD/YdcC